MKIREREEMRSALGSDYESDDEREDVTREQVQVKKPTNFQPIEDQQASMLEILQEYSKPKINVDVSNMTQRKRVGMWLDESDGMMRKPLQVPHNTPAVPQITYRLPAETRKEPLQLLDSQERRDSMFNSPLRQTRDPAIQSNSDAALFSRVLRENRLPKPKIMSFDGDPKRFKMFMASFQSNVDEMLDEGDDKLKLSLLLDQCTGEAFELIEECVMLRPELGYRTAMEKLEKRFGKNHLIARSYIDGVTKGGPIKPNDVKALIKLSDDMRKCQNVLSELRFASDLDSTGTIESIMDRLPESLQNQWVKRSNKVLNEGREPTFRDLTVFVEERADDYNSKYGQYIAEKRSTSSKQKQQENTGKQRERKRHMTTLATTADGAGASAAGHDLH